MDVHILMFQKYLIVQLYAADKFEDTELKRAYYETRQGEKPHSF